MVSNSVNKDISTLEDVQYIVDTFYGKVRQDDLLKDVFEDVIQDRWPQHLAKMYTFWETVLLDARTYSGAPFVPHAQLPVHFEHFERWVKLWKGTVYGKYLGENANKATWQGERMAEMFLYKIEQIQEDGFMY